MLTAALLAELDVLDTYKGLFTRDIHKKAEKEGLGRMPTKGRGVSSYADSAKWQYSSKLQSYQYTAVM